MTTCRKCRRPIRLELADDGPHWTDTAPDAGTCRHYPDPGELAAVADFDHPFAVRPDGSLGDAPAGVYAPDVFHVDGPGDIDIMGDGWEALAGYTGQHAYSGAVMHSSEVMGGRLADDILSTPGVYVCTVVNVHPVDPYPHEWSPSGARCTRSRVNDSGQLERCGVAGTGDPDDGPCELHPDYDPDTAADYDPDPEPAGWAVLRLEPVPCIAGCGEPAEPGMSTCAACGGAPTSSGEWCVIVPDGTDTNGDVWNRCTVHGHLVLDGAYVCEGYRAPGPSTESADT